METTNPAESYERYFVGPLFAPCAARLVELVAPKPGERVLDLACGTGIVARHVARRVGPTGAVTALDINPHMLAVAREAAAKEGARIDFYEGKAEALPFPDNSFDLVTCQHAFQFFEGRTTAAAEIRRILAPGGRAAIATWQGLSQHPFYAQIDRLMLERFGISGVGQIFSFGDAAELESLLSGAGLQGVTVEPMSIRSAFPNPDQFLAIEIDIDVAAVPSMQQMTPTERLAVVAELQTELAPSLQRYIHDGEVRMEFHAQLATGQRVREPAGAKSA